MTDMEDSGLQSLLSTCCQRYNIENVREKWVDVYRDVIISSTSSDGVCSVDFAIGPYTSVDHNSTGSPMLKRDRVLSTRPAPHLVITMSSSDRKTNSAKRKECAKCGVQQYVMVDREKRKVKVYGFDDIQDDTKGCLHLSAATDANHGTENETSGYRYKDVLKKDELIRVRCLQSFKLTADDLLGPKRTPSNIFNSSFQRSSEVAILRKTVAAAFKAALESYNASLAAWKATKEAREKVAQKREAAFTVFCALLESCRGEQEASRLQQRRNKLRRKAKILEQEANELEKEEWKLWREAWKREEEGRKLERQAMRAEREFVAYMQKIIRIRRRRKREKRDDG